MKEFIERILHQNAEITHCNALQPLPLILRTGYEFYQMRILDQDLILAEPKENVSLSALRKHYAQIERLTGEKIVLYLKYLNSHSRNKLIEDGIPFVWENHQIYIPFSGVLVKQGEAREIKPCYRISFLTQKFLLSALYGEWDDLSVTAAAERLDVSKMSITRVFDEIEGLRIPVVVQEGKRRKYIRIGSKKEIWDVAQPFLRSPLLREYHLENAISSLPMKSGISGLSEMSMLEGETYAIYAAVKKEIRALGIDKEKQVPIDEVPGCIVHEVGYRIPFCQGRTIDPLSIFMMLKDIDEPRIQIALDKMLEDYVW